MFHSQQQEQQPKQEQQSTSLIAGGREGKVSKDAKQRRCFHCGLLGHMAAHCSAKGEERRPGGKAAFQAFVDGGSQTQDRMPQRYYSLYHYYKLQQWVQQQLQQQQHKQPNAFVHFVDPISLAFAVLSESSASNGHNPDIQVRCLRKNLFHSYRELFDQVIQKLEVRYRERIDCRLGNDITEDVERVDLQHTSCTTSRPRTITNTTSWQAILTQAVKDGTPANFSNPHALREYTLERLIPRCRQLHHLILDHDNPYAEKIRARLLRRPSSRTTSNHQNHIQTIQPCNNDDKNTITPRSKATISVCSLGGGPGYDHLAICMVTRFLHDMISTASSIQSDYQQEKQPLHIHTRVFDLWDQHWKPIAEELMQSWEDIPCPFAATTTTSMHHADVRLSLNAPSNHDLYNAIPLADLIVFQYVLHENASCLLQNVGPNCATTTQRIDPASTDPHGGAPADTTTTTIGNSDPTATSSTTPTMTLLLRQDSTVVDIFRHAKLGAIIICTDSVHTLWPAIQETATVFGWSYMSDAERNHNIVMGPNSFLVLERTRIS